MGIGILGGCTSSPYGVRDSNPDPKVFKIKECRIIGKCMVLLVKYPNCQNFEGDKILVYHGVSSVAQLLAFTDGKLDPHFMKDCRSPIARFKPTTDGMAMAIDFCLMIQGAYGYEEKTYI